MPKWQHSIAIGEWWLEGAVVWFPVRFNVVVLIIVHMEGVWNPRLTLLPSLRVRIFHGVATVLSFFKP